MIPGLCVDALDGAPGVRSKRWSGVTEPPPRRSTRRTMPSSSRAWRVRRTRRARFVCAAAWRGGAAASSSRRGAVEGTIVAAPSGAHGFGYDPYFHSSELGMTLADATTEQKRLVSHRGRAFDALLAALRARGVVR